ncbi:ATP-binding cassette domain-containing protein [Actinoplanes missouriensis]|uniref:ATP-binding cassette domain-containing protein n=1 Tax=Actinoplanes missouriensis TaxID=1866 RepID=UPI0033E7BA2F
MTDNDLAVEVSGLTKAYGKTTAVAGLDLAVPRGCVYGVLGPNGAGKTTTLRVLATLVRPDSGTARVFGHDVVREATAVRQRVSLTGQFASVDDDLTGAENLILLAKLRGFTPEAGRRRAGNLLEAFDLAESAARPVRTYSGGMRRRLDIAAALVVRTDLIFLDEPTTGLDPRSRNQVWEVIRALVRRGSTVLLTTQYLEEADRLADRIALVDNGVVVAEGTPDELKASVGAGSLRVELRDAADVPEASRVLSAVLGVPAEAVGGNRVAVRAGHPRDAARAVGELTRSIEVEDFSMDRPSLDQVFLALTGKPATVAAAEPAGTNGRPRKRTRS